MYSFFIIIFFFLEFEILMHLVMLLVASIFNCSYKHFKTSCQIKGYFKIKKPTTLKDS